MLDNGNLVGLSTELLTYDGFDEALCDDEETFDGSYELISDVVVEFTPDGEIVAEYPVADHLDPVDDPRDQNVCGLSVDWVVPDWLYRAQGFSDALDWTHANGVIPDPSGDALTVSVRHLDAILQIDRATGELLWRFGPGGDFARSTTLPTSRPTSTPWSGRTTGRCSSTTTATSEHPDRGSPTTLRRSAG